MSIYVFTGPTIAASEARQWLEAVYLPPVSQGDIISLLRHKPKIIGIIDGYFDSVPAVWHKEILLALSKGLYVVGAASMGALRAAELHSFGMVGIGEIFEWYRDNVIDADDEVAVYHAPREYDYKPFSEPLVNIRKTLQAAYGEGIITQSAMEIIIGAGQQTHYWDRSYEHILEKGMGLGVTAEEASRLKDYVQVKAINLKKRDAVELLRHIADLSEKPLPTKATFELQETIFLARLIDRDQTINEAAGSRLTAHDLVNHARLEFSDFLAIRERAAMNTLSLDFARHLGLTVSDEERQEEKSIILQTLALSSDEEIEAWRMQNDLMEDEFEQLIADLALIRKINSVYSASVNNYELLRQFRIERKYEEIVRTAVDKEKRLSDNWLPPNESLSNLIASYFVHKGVAMPENVYDYAAELGFQDYPSFLLEIEKHYRYHQHLSGAHAQSGQ